MNSVNHLLIFLLFFLFIMVTEAGKKSVDKIIIHVPYKIHKHHHIHTKYKIITVPAPQKENTVIYFTEEKQPDIKLPQMKTQEAAFIPPHQQSAGKLLQSLATGHTKDSVMEAQEVSTTLHQLTPDVQTNQIEGKDLIPNYTLGPLPPQFSYKPMIIPPQESFSHKFLPFPFQPMILPHQGALIPQYSLQFMMPPKKVVQDNIAHSNNQVYKTIINPDQKPTSYKVKEEVKEHPNLRLMKRKPKSLHHNLKNINVPLSAYHYKNLMNNMIQSDQEYEHVGYLIIDGDSRKIVGKNFKDEISLSR